MKNRYDDLLREHNQEIINLIPYNPLFFLEGAKVIAELAKPGARILEIGSGEGDSALPVLQNTQVLLDLLDVSQEMNDAAAQKLIAFKDRTTFICEDAYDYLVRSEPYDIVFAAWTVHNFTWTDKRRLFEALAKNLTPGGVFILLDKVYPGTGTEALFDHQNKRYQRFLAPEVADAIIAHEQEDKSDDYRMDEQQLLEELRSHGFSKFEIVDRVERDVILVVTK